MLVTLAAASLSVVDQRHTGNFPHHFPSRYLSRFTCFGCENPSPTQTSLSKENLVQEKPAGGELRSQAQQSCRGSQHLQACVRHCNTLLYPYALRHTSPHTHTDPLAHKLKKAPSVPLRTPIPSKGTRLGCLTWNPTYYLGCTFENS